MHIIVSLSSLTSEKPGSTERYLFSDEFPIFTEIWAGYQKKGVDMESVSQYNMSDCLTV